MNWMSYFNMVCECVNKTTQLYLDGQDKGFALGNLLESLCAADEKAHRLVVYYGALRRTEREDWRASLQKKFDELLEEMTACRGYYYVIKPKCESFEDMRRLSLIHKVLLNRMERANNQSDEEDEKENFEVADKYCDLGDLIEDYAEDIFAVIRGEEIDC